MLDFTNSALDLNHLNSLTFTAQNKEIVRIAVIELNRWEHSEPYPGDLQSDIDACETWIMNYCIDKVFPIPAR